MVVFQWIRQSGQTSQISLTVKTCGSLIYNQDQKEKSVRWVSGAKPRVYINNKKTQTIFYVVRSSLLKPWSKLTVCQVNLQPRFQSVMVHLALAPKTYAHALSCSLTHAVSHSTLHCSYSHTPAAFPYVKLVQGTRYTDYWPKTTCSDLPMISSAQSQGKQSSSSINWEKIQT